MNRGMGLDPGPEKARLRKMNWRLVFYVALLFVAFTWGDWPLLAIVFGAFALTRLSAIEDWTRFTAGGTWPPKE